MRGTTLNGMPVIISPHLPQIEYERQAYPRSLGRSKRRRAMGHPQHTRQVEKSRTDAVVIAGTIHISAAGWAAVKERLAKSPTTPAAP